MANTSIHNTTVWAIIDWENSLGMVDTKPVCQLKQTCRLNKNEYFCSNSNHDWDTFIQALAAIFVQTFKC